MIIFILLLTTITLTKVNASNIKVTLELQDNIYSNKHYGNSYTSTAYYFLKANGNLVYCIEGEKLITNTNYKVSKTNSLNLNNETLKKLELISYYGYDFKGHQTVKYRMATQELIWELLSIDDVTWSTKKNNAGKTIDIEKEKSEILSLIDKHYITPKFSTSESIIGQTIKLYDENNVLNNFSVSNGNAYIEGNYLFVDIKNTNNEITLTSKNYSEKNTILYESGTSQKVMEFGFTFNNIITEKYNFTGTYGKITVNKITDSNFIGNSSLENAVYGIYKDNELISTSKTNKEGQAIFNNLSYGTYQIKEITPSYGYWLDKNSYEFNINNEKSNHEITSLEPLQYNTLEIKKVYFDNILNKNIEEPNISFNIYYENKLVDTVTTNESGIAITNLPSGNYTIKQVNVMEGTYISKDQQVKIDNKDVSITIINDMINSKITINNYDEETNELINGGIFKIFDTKNNSYVSKVTITENGSITLPNNLRYGKYILEQISPPNGYEFNNKKITFEVLNNDDIVLDYYNNKKTYFLEIYKFGENNTLLSNVEFNLYNNNELIETLITNENGYVKSKNLNLGNYYLKETKTNDDYILPNEIIRFEIKDNDVTLNINNDKKQVEIIPKTSAKSYISLLGTILIIVGVILKICNKVKKCN